MHKYEYKKDKATSFQVKTVTSAEGTQCRESACIINIKMEELLKLRSKERVGRGRRPDAAAPTALQGCPASCNLSITRKRGFMYVYANVFFYSMKLLTGTAGTISAHTGKLAPKC